jgi:hypothetical protein
MRLAMTWAVPAVILAMTGAFAASAAEPAAVNAVWVEKDLSFTHMGFTSYYSCDGIRDKVRYVLKQVSARPGFKVTVSGCVNGSGPEIMPRVRVRAALPREATAADGGSTPFPAQWRTLQFRGTPNSEVQDGDCELMEQLVREVLLPLGVREVDGSRLACVPHQASPSAINLKLMALEPRVPAPTKP